MRLALLLVLVVLFLAGAFLAWGRWQRRRYLREFYEGTGSTVGQSVFVRPRSRP